MQQMCVPLPTEANLRNEERFGRADYLTRLSRENLYSRKLTGERLAAYFRGYAEAQARAPHLWNHGTP